MAKKEKKTLNQYVRIAPKEFSCLLLRSFNDDAYHVDVVAVVHE